MNYHNIIKCIEANDLETLKDFAKKGYKFRNTKFPVLAVMRNNLEILKFLYSQNCRWDEDTCSYAAEYGNLDCLIYARQHGCPWDSKTCELAAYNGHVDCLQYAHINGCKWNERTCFMAVVNDNVECLKYAHQNNCRLNSRTIIASKKQFKIHCYEYIINNVKSHDRDKCNEANTEQCVICMDAASRIKYNPCKHVVCCISCHMENIKRVSTCPMCRTDIENCILV